MGTLAGAMLPELAKDFLVDDLVAGQGPGAARQDLPLLLQPVTTVAATRRLAPKSAKRVMAHLSGIDCGEGISAAPGP